MSQPIDIRPDNQTECCAFSLLLDKSGLHPFTAQTIEILQINVGRQCNLSCKHCHLEAGPHRTESMSQKVLQHCLEVAQDPRITTIDITGGAPEKNPSLAWFISNAAKLNKRLIVRTNLTILDAPPYDSFIDLYSKYAVELVASFPDVHENKTNRQRGSGVFEREIAMLTVLNSKGYGKPGSGKILDLVHNPLGAFLPGSQNALETHYKTLLLSTYHIVFNTLFCITNVPLGRFKNFLIASDNYEEYMATLTNTFNPKAASNAMCRSTISVGWDGTIYDCDFNFSYNTFSKREIVVGNHCLACTAGAGSSCQGVTAS
jgi:radical SAM/Cys-rich protein